MFGECGERGGETGVAQHDRVEAPRDVPEFGDRLPDFGLGEVQVGLAGCRFRLEEAQRERQAEEVLLCAVVQVSFEPAPFVVTGGEDAATG